ncbi:GntR family transcriptional regulator [Sphingomonas sp. QA11]|uniref:GntR family transcriptional regulator n=1 Tax=Sphingomonas sp. QA11 TaxID=2950605 RepID=UPI002348F308|nr:GntR family transcriptional regulator [Sphingomonas sp. QA11]WCM25937.1 GntR family transcriptional regulator [Sphingomonas sp. QA11]
MAPEAVIAGRAYHLLKADLVAGRFKPGEILVERAIAVEHIFRSHRFATAPGVSSARNFSNRHRGTTPTPRRNTIPLDGDIVGYPSTR